MKTRGFEIAKGFEDKDINLPVRKTKYSAGYDIECAEDTVVPKFVPGTKPTLIPTGVKAYMQDDEVLYLYNRSSNPLKYGLILSNSVGIIDTQYRGEVKGIFHCITHKENNFFRNSHVIHKGDKIMQIEMSPIYDFDLEQVETLSETERGANGFGSTGK